MNKKIFLAALLGLGISSSFAITVIGPERTGNHCKMYAPEFRFSTKRANAVNGFKFYAYFANTLGEMPLVNRDWEPPYPGSVYQFTSHVYRYEVDFKNITIPSNSYFPNANTQFFRVEPLFNGCNQGYPSEKHNDDIVIESKTGEVLYGRHPDFKSRIGVLANTCPYGNNTQNRVIIAFDTEHTNNKTNVTPKDDDSLPFSTDRSMLFLRFCAINLTEGIPQAPYDYIVLRLDENCPDGTFPFKRRHNANDNESAAIYGLAHPNSYTKNYVYLNYCFVPKNSNSKLKHPFEKYHSSDIPDQYGVFANSGSTYMEYSKIHVDDEDSNNLNEWQWEGKTIGNNPIQQRIFAIMYGVNDDRDTEYQINMWNGTKKALAKSVNTEKAEATKTEIKSASAEIKGVDYTSIAFELKTAGNAKISIKNINGTEVARFNEQNLDAGIHIINWDSGIVMPRGRYIVTIQHNGSISAKSITLK